MSEPIDSASILVIRDNLNDGALEVLMVKRNQDIAFAGGAYVFPGGKADPEDQEGIIPQQSFPVGYAELAITAFREVFEESGIIIGSSVNALDHRSALIAGELSFREFIQKADVALRFDDIVPFARWVTPRVYPKRFDTRFFVARAPSGQEATPDYGEVVEAIWVKPLDFIDEFREDMMFPTLMNLKLLGEADTTDEAIERAKVRKLVTVEPKLVDGIRIIDPAAGYGEIDQGNIHQGVKSDKS